MADSITSITLNPSLDMTYSVEKVEPDKKLKVFNIKRYVGGGGLNVAQALKRLGKDCNVLWTKGGNTGDLLEDMLKNDGIVSQGVGVSDYVRENQIITETSTGRQYRFGMPGAKLNSKERADWSDTVENISPGTQMIIISGSLPPGADPEWFGEMIKKIPEGVRIIVDTKGEALKKAISSGVYLIKPNVNELENLLDKDLEGEDQIEKGARELLKQGNLEAVLVSMGRGGALLVNGQSRRYFSAPAVPMRSKVGAGDSMVAGLVYALSKNMNLVEATKYAVAAGAAAVMQKGTELCTKEDTERLFHKM